ncbi:MAG: translation initiation factor IF-3 [Phycisphaerales bacterium]
MNHMIRLSPIRVVGPDNEQIGVIETPAAIRMAEEQGLDLVEIVPNSRPPVCKIMDYGKYKYELSKKESKNRAAAKSQELKEIRLGRSIKIDPHDVWIRVEQSRRFLMQGHKVQITQRFRGREMMHRHLGIERLQKIVTDLADISKVESPPRFFGRAATIMLAPDKAKIEALKRKMKKEELEALEEEEDELEEADAGIEYEDDDDDATPEGAEGEAAESEAKPAAKGGPKEPAKPDAKAGRAEDDDKKGKKKGPKDNRARNPIDDEMRALLGE